LGVPPRGDTAASAAQPAERRTRGAPGEARGRAAPTEMRRLLGVLRQEGEPVGSLTPAPSLADLSSLVTQVHDAGLQVWIHVEGQRGPVPPGVDLSAYRIIQEALTNVIKHAYSSCADVTICYRADSVPVEIINEGRAKPGAAVAREMVESGHGIIGMRERVAVFGGEFAAGPQPGGGFRVWARLPIPEVAS